MATDKHRQTFGPKRVPHTVIIAKGERFRHFTIGTRALVAGSALATTLMVACLSVPAVFALQSDGTLEIAARQWHERDGYEKRIAALRDQLDRATSRQFLSEKMVETKVDVLLGQQEELSARYDKLRPLLDRARDTGLLASRVPIPTSNPRFDDGVAGMEASGPLDSVDDGAASGNASAAAPPVHADAAEAGEPPVASGALAFASQPLHSTFPAFGPEASQTTDQIRTGSIDIGRSASGASAATASTSGQTGDRHVGLSAQTIDAIGKAIGKAEIDQVFHLQRLAQTARSRAVKIASAVEAVGIRIPSSNTEKAEGGPYEPVPASYRPSAGLDFDNSYAELDDALDALQKVQSVVDTLPLAEPMPHDAISSTFGIRRDPFLGRSALHSGIDYAVPRGRPITIEATGTVIHAGPMGGYGNMVEIDHGHGVTTRYGHMSRIDVSVGDKLGRDAAIGAVGSTGRSTGPHLHYEVRIDGQAIDPTRFYRIGTRIASLG